MIQVARTAVLAVAALCVAAAGHALAATAIVSVRNPTDLARASETIVLDAAKLRSLMAVDDIRRVHVRDQSSGRDLLTQAVDTNDDGVFEELVFQVDLGPKETRRFLLNVGERQVPRREDFKAYGRFVRERRDDFAWENDRIAHRMYGAALETWAQEPLTSSAVDVWTKRTPRLVINDWYMIDDYHHDHGEGADLYSAGTSRGCGGNGIWAGGQLYPSRNFRASRVLASGPIRVMFELTYDQWDAAGVRVSEVKRITLDAGHNFDRFESRYSTAGTSPVLTQAVGIKKNAGAASKTLPDQGSLRTWETLKDNGELGCAVIVRPDDLATFSEDKNNYLVVTRVHPDGTALYYAGFGWSKSDFRTAEDWDRYIARYAARLRSPVEVTLTAP
jgi:pectinesterase